MLIEFPFYNNLVFNDLHQIGKGATSAVYSGYIIIIWNLLSYRKNGDTIYCLKIYDNPFENERTTKSFFREIEKIFSFYHQFIIKVFDYINIIQFF